MKEKMQKTGSFGKNMCLALFDRVKVSWVNKKKMFSKILFFQGVRNSIFFRVCLKTSSIIKSFPVQISRESTRLFFNIFIIFPTLTKNQEKRVIGVFHEENTYAVKLPLRVKTKVELGV